MAMTSEALAARLDVLGLALQEVCRALAPAQKGQVAHAIRMNVADLAVRPLSPTADEAVTGELVPVLAALQDPPRSSA